MRIGLQSRLKGWEVLMIMVSLRNRSPTRHTVRNCPLGILLIRHQNGSALVLFALTLFVLLGFVSLVTDVGMLTFHKARLSHAVDASALAGAQELIYDTGNSSDTADRYMNKNGYQEASVDISLEDDNTAIRVNASYEVSFTFARLMGFNTATVRATARGKVLPIIGVESGVRPLAIEEQPLVFSETYLLKKGGGGGSNGNYGPIELGGRGASVYFNNIVNGYEGRLMVGDRINTEPGNMSGPTEDGVNSLISQCSHTPRCTWDHFNPECPRVITIVVVDTLDVNGRSTVQIKGFASFFLEGVGGRGNDCEIYGRFIRAVTSGETGESQADYGLYGVKLTR